MFGIGSSKPPHRIDSLISAGTRIDGDVTFTGGLRIDGEIRGNVSARPGQPSVLVIGEAGRVQGEVRAPRVVVNGFVSGSIQVSELLELQPCARISGQLQYAALEIHRGAVIEVELTRPAPVTAAATAGAAPLDRPESVPLPLASAA
jgi:cytoskeletal protein CcmA (bactofilin family)